MNKSYKISVIIPTYYRNEYLIRAVRSVIKQTYDNYEIIIIDDSKEKHAETTVQDLKNKHPRTIIQYLHSKGKRQGYARNLGMKNSNGDFISFLDDDDQWYKDKLMYEVKIFKDYGCNIVIYGGRTIHDKEGNIVEKYIPKYDRFLAKHMIKLFNFVAFPAFTFHKSVLEEVGYLDEKFKTHEDWDFLNRVALKYDFFPLKEVVAKVNKHDNNRDREHHDVWENDKLTILSRFKPYWTVFTYLLYFMRQTKLKIAGRKY